MNNNWRLTAEARAILVTPFSDRVLYLCATEKKNYQKDVEKFIDSVSYSVIKKKVDLNLNEFNLKIELSKDDKLSNAKVFMKSEQLPEKDSWYLVGNAYTYGIPSLLMYNEVKDGVISATVEAIFTTDEDEKARVNFITTTMPEYKECYNEFKRRLNCELTSKTKKFIPGHKYDSLEESRYYLCKVLSRKEKESSSHYLTNVLSMPEAYLYVNELLPGENSISDILKNRKIGSGRNDIKISRSFTPLVDAEESIVDDFSGAIENYMADNLNNYLKEWEQNGVDQFTALGLFSGLSVTSNKKIDTLVNDEIKSILEEALRKLIDRVILENYDISRGRADLTISSKNSLEENIVSCTNLLFEYIADPNLNRIDYYNELWNNLGININNLITERISTWSPNNLSRDIDTYVKNCAYFRIRELREDRVFTQRIKSTNYSLKMTTLKDKYGEGELTSCIKNLLEYAKINNGYGITMFEIYNVGTKKEPKEYISSLIELDDIIKYLGGINKLSDKLKSEILKFKFTGCQIDFDRNITVE